MGKDKQVITSHLITTLIYTRVWKEKINPTREDCLLKIKDLIHSSKLIALQAACGQGKIRNEVITYLGEVVNLGIHDLRQA